jgi:hypothetical protein
MTQKNLGYVTIRDDDVFDTLSQHIVFNRNIASAYSCILFGIRIGRFETVEEIKEHCEKNYAYLSARVEHYFNQLPVTKM